jgi:Ca2+/Na+ antiporter
MNTDAILDAPEAKKKRNKSGSYSIAISLVGLILVGFLFKTAHWPGAGLLILFPSLLLCSLLLYKFFTRKQKEIGDYLILALAVGWLIYLFFTYFNLLF